MYISRLIGLAVLLPLSAFASDFIVEFNSPCKKLEKIASRVFGRNSNYAVVSETNLKKDELKKISCVKHIERNKAMSGQSALLHRVFENLPQDPKFQNQWALNNPGSPGSDINVLKVWDKFLTGKKSIKVAVMDTGIDWDHEDLKDNLYTNPGESGPLAYNGIDDDGNGYVDDVHGWNALDNSPNSRDDHGHGTHVAGIIGAVGDNGIGVSGVNWEVSLVPIKMLGKTNSGYVSKTIEALEYALANDIDIINASWSGLPYSDIILGLMNKLSEKGVLFIAASGNETGNTHTPVHFFPEFYQVPTVISAAATTKAGEISVMSNWGEDVADLAAPGDHVLSTYFGNKYSEMTGTSMAAPQIAGACALLKAYYPWMSALEIKKRILASTRPLEALTMKVNTQGTLNILNAINGRFPMRKLPRLGPWKAHAYSYETEHPIKERKDLSIKVPGAKFIRAVFSKVDFSGRDKLVIRSKIAPGMSYGQAYQGIKGEKEDFTSAYVPGEELIIQYVGQDRDLESWGFRIERLEVIWEKDWSALSPQDFTSEILARPWPKDS